MLSKDSAVILDHSYFAIHEYARAIGEFVDPSSILMISKMPRNRTRIFFNSSSNARNFVDKFPVIKVFNTDIKTRLFMSPLSIVYLNNVDPWIENDLIVNILLSNNIPVKRVDFVNAGIHNFKFKHIKLEKRFALVESCVIPPKIVFKHNESDITMLLEPKFPDVTPMGNVPPPIISNNQALSNLDVFPPLQNKDTSAGDIQDSDSTLPNVIGPNQSLPGDSVPDLTLTGNTVSNQTPSGNSNLTLPDNSSTEQTLSDNSLSKETLSDINVSNQTLTVNTISNQTLHNDSDSDQTLFGHTDLDLTLSVDNDSNQTLHSNMEPNQKLSGGTDLNQKLAGNTVSDQKLSGSTIPMQTLPNNSDFNQTMLSNNSNQSDSGQFLSEGSQPLSTQTMQELSDILDSDSQSPDISPMSKSARKKANKLAKKTGNTSKVWTRSKNNTVVQVHIEKN